METLTWSTHGNRRLEQFLSCPADEVFYGGAAGGAKTEGLCIESIGQGDQNIFNNPNWKVLILRRTFPELENSIISRLKTLIEKPGYGRYDGVKHQISVPGKGVIRFRHIKNEDDLSKFQSDEYVKIIFDELTTFTKRMFLFLFSRLRSRDPNIKPTIRSASNPGNLGHAWVKERYITDRKPGEIYHEKVTLPDGRETDWSQCFVPSNVFDNKFLMQSDPLYARRLMELPEVEKQAFLYGNWDIFSGQFFPEFSEDHLIDDFKIPSDWPMWIGLDWGYMTKCAVLFFTENPSTGEVYCFHEIYVSKIQAKDVAGLIKAKLGDAFTNLRGRYSDKRIRIRDEEGTSISTQEKFAFEGVYFTIVDDNRMEGWHRVRELLLKDKEGKCKFRVFRSCLNFIRVMAEMIHDPNNPEDMDKRAETHLPDACFVAGTKITTDEGLKNIEDVKIGDRVLASDGFYRVSNSGMTGIKDIWELKTSAGILRGTGDHPIFIKDGSKKLLSELTPGDILLDRFASDVIQCVTWKLKLFLDGFKSLAESPFIFMETILGPARYAFIGLYGNITMGKFQRDSTFTTKTMIGLITKFQICNSFISRNILPITWLPWKLKTDLEGSCKSMPSLLQGFGISPQNLKSFINGLQKSLGKIDLGLKQIVNFVEVGIKPLFLLALNSAILIAKWLLSVPDSVVLEVKPLNIKSPVYDLTVEDKHQFIANGILVSNCRYFAISRHPSQDERQVAVPYSSVTGYVGMSGGEPKLRNTLKRLAGMPRQSIRFLDGGLH